jgi:hypothetical protein
MQLKDRSLSIHPRAVGSAETATVQASPDSRFPVHVEAPSWKSRLFERIAAAQDTVPAPSPPMSAFVKVTVCTLESVLGVRLPKSTIARSTASVENPDDPLNPLSFLIFAVHPVSANPTLKSRKSDLLFPQFWTMWL